MLQVRMSSLCASEKKAMVYDASFHLHGVIYIGTGLCKPLTLHDWLQMKDMENHDVLVRSWMVMMRPMYKGPLSYGVDLEVGFVLPVPGKSRNDLKMVAIYDVRQHVQRAHIVTCSLSLSW